MTTPSFFFGLLLASACALLFHFIRGGSISRMLLFVATSWVAFFLGSALGNWLDWQFGRYGSLNLFPAFLAAFVGLITASILAGPEKPRPSKKK